MTIFFLLLIAIKYFLSNFTNHDITLYSHTACSMAQHTLIKLSTFQNFDLINFIRIFYFWNPKLFVDYGVWAHEIDSFDIYIHWVRPETPYVWVVAFAIKLINFLVGRSVCFLCTQHVNRIFVQSQGSSFGWKHFLRRLIIELLLTACEYSKRKIW